MGIPREFWKSLTNRIDSILLMNCLAPGMVVLRVRNHMGDNKHAQVGVRHVPIIWSIFLCAKSVRFEPMFIEATRFLGNCCGVDVWC